MKSFDQMSQLHACLRLMGDIAVRTEQRSWDVVREKAREARLALLPVANSQLSYLSPDRVGALDQVAVALKSIVDASSKHTPGADVPRVAARIKQMVLEHEEQVLLAISDLQVSMENVNG